jgi:predicted protein tyrosine phosphatase
LTHIVVCGLSDLARTVEKHRARHMVSLLSPQTPVPPFDRLGVDRHLFLEMHDISSAVDGMAAPDRTHVENLIAFARNWTREDPLLIHCWMGISRSTAAAYISAIAVNPQLDEQALALELRRRSPSATPNERLIALADDILDRRGAMKDAIKRIGRGAEAAMGRPFILPVDPIIRKDH